VRDVRQWDDDDLERVVMSDQKRRTVDIRIAALNFQDQTQRRDREARWARNTSRLIRTCVDGERRGGYRFGMLSATVVPGHVDDGWTPRPWCRADRADYPHQHQSRVEGFFVHRIDLTSRDRASARFVISIPRPRKAHRISRMTSLLWRHGATKLRWRTTKPRYDRAQLEFGRRFGIAWDC